VKLAINLAAKLRVQLPVIKQKPLRSCGVVDSRPCITGLATVLHSVNCWPPPYSDDQVATLALCLEMAQE
jgi:hypothetical protein